MAKQTQTKGKRGVSHMQVPALLQYRVAQRQSAGFSALPKETQAVISRDIRNLVRVQLQRSAGRVY